MKATDIYSLLEAQQDLFEVEMSPSNLKKLASQVDARVGMEFEMVVPDAEGDEDDYDQEREPDMGRDERVEDIEDIVRFFGEEDDYMGNMNSPGTLDRLRDELEERFYEWQEGKIREAWTDYDGKTYFATWVKDNVDPDEVAEYAGTPEDLFGERNPSKDDYADFMLHQWDTEGSYYDEAYDSFREERQSEGDYDQSDFLSDIGIRYMSDVNDTLNVAVDWPYYEEPNWGGGGESIDSIADSFSEAIGKTVYSSTSYHGARRSPDAYSLEPDSSIDASSGEAGLEFISPPMPIDEMFDDLKKVREWADQRGCYTNRSTGLHINVSVPDYSLDKLDYVKLAVLLGDKYVLDQFNRVGTQWAKSAFDIVKRRAEDQPDDANRLLDQLKAGVEQIASKILHSGRTDKYTSINTKDNYVEFRSAGGDWLDANFDKIENTLLRFVVALDAACDPNKYKKEYYKGLYKLLKPKDPNSDMSLIAKYMAGQITRSELLNSIEATRKERFKGQGVGIIQKDDLEEGDWVVEYDDGNKQDAIYIAKNAAVPTEGAAWKVAQKYKPQWFKPDTIEFITVTPFSYGDSVEGLNLYRAEYAHKYTSVVAPDEETAREYIKVIDADYFSSYPDTEITLTDEKETSRRKIFQMLEWQNNKLKIGEEYLKRPKIWSVRARDLPSGTSRYYIAAVTRDEAMGVLNRLEGQNVEGLGVNIELYVNDIYPSSDTYEAYKKAQEDLIQQREEERERDRRAAEFNAGGEADIDISGLTVYRVHSSNGYMYVVGRNGSDAAAIACKLDPQKFPSNDVADLTVERKDEAVGPEMIKAMYVSQQKQLQQPTQDSDGINIPQEFTQGQPRISDMSSYKVTNTNTGEVRWVAASTNAGALQRAREQYPEFAAGPLSAQLWN